MTRFCATRRQFFGLAAGGAAATALIVPQESQAQTQTKARIVIIGAGAGGTALANRLVRRLEGAQITLIDPRAQHLYQPGLTLVATGLKPADYVTSKTSDWLPDGVTLIPEKAAAIDPLARTVATDSGQVLAYDFLVVAPGLILDHEAIEGTSRSTWWDRTASARFMPGRSMPRAHGRPRRSSPRTAASASPARDRNEMRRGASDTFLIDDITKRRQWRQDRHALHPPRLRARSSGCPSSRKRCGCCSRIAASPAITSTP